MRLEPPQLFSASFIFNDFAQKHPPDGRSAEEDVEGRLTAGVSHGLTSFGESRAFAVPRSALPCILPEWGSSSNLQFSVSAS